MTSLQSGTKLERDKLTCDTYGIMCIESGRACIEIRRVATIDTLRPGYPSNGFSAGMSEVVLVNKSTLLHVQKLLLKSDSASSIIYLTMSPF